MRENDEITGLFHERLTDAEMTVREGFWEKLQSDLSQTEAVAAASVDTEFAPSVVAAQPKRLLLAPRFHRVAAAASVVLVLGAASAAFLYLSPKEEIKEAFTQVAALTPDGSLHGDVVQENFPSIHGTDPMAQKPVAQRSVSVIPAGLTALDEDEEGSVSVHVSITISQQVYGNVQAGNDFFNNRMTRNNNDYQSTEGDANHTSQSLSVEEEPTSLLPKAHTLRKWALKAGVGTSLPKGNFNMPLTASVSVERYLNKSLSLEAGLLYSRLQTNRHTLGVPVKLNLALLSTPKVDLYATVGGAAEMYVGSLPDNDIAEPIRLSVAAGVGIRYKLSDRFALFAEPTVSHHFNADEGMRSLRTERATNLNLLCGVRMTY